jgi:hypothetical protein
VRDSRRLEPPHSKRRQRSEDSGRPGNSPLASPEGAGSGETRTATSQRAEENEASGQPGDSTSARAGRSRIRGDPETDRETALEGEDSGEPGDSTPGPTKDARFGGHRRSITGKSRKTSDRGNSKARWEAALVQRICGATRVSKASSAEGCESRGNSKLHRRHGLKMQEAGRPAATSEAQHEERRRGDARGFTSGSVAGSHFEATRRKRPEAERTMYGSIDLSGHQIDGPVGNRI